VKRDKKQKKEKGKWNGEMRRLKEMNGDERGEGGQ
jgi:hypothetical protein